MQRQEQFERNPDNPNDPNKQGPQSENRAGWSLADYRRDAIRFTPEGRVHSPETSRESPSSHDTAISDSQQIPEVYNGFITSESIKKLETDYLSNSNFSLDKSKNNILHRFIDDIVGITDNRLHNSKHNKEGSDILDNADDISSILQGLKLREETQAASYRKIVPLLKSIYDIAKLGGFARS